MLLKLILLMTLVPAIELVLIVLVHSSLAENIGSANAFLVTIGIIIGTGILGAHLARSQGFSVLKRFQAASREGSLPTQEIVDGVMVLIGGFLLLTPGFLSDAFGFSLLIPYTRNLYRVALARALAKGFASGAINIQMHGFRGPPRQPASHDTIDAEYIDPDKPHI